jgi:hypothetical protein
MSVLGATHDMPVLTGVRSTPPCPKIHGFRTFTASCPGSGAALRQPAETITAESNTPTTSHFVYLTQPPFVPIATDDSGAQLDAAKRWRMWHLVGNRLCRARYSLLLNRYLSA